jgi:hypothetical protein
MLKIVSATALAVLVCATPSRVFSADFDGSKPLLCATIDAHFCDVGEVCYRTLPALLGAPQFMHINFAKKAIIGPQRTTEIWFMEPSEGQLRLCQLAESKTARSRCDDWSESERRILGDVGEFAPSDEPGSELLAIK